MDPLTDVIVPSWWGDVLAGADLRDSYQAAESLSVHLERAANSDGLGDFQKLVLQVLAMATSAMLNAEDWLEPFTPAMQFDGKRTIVPADLEADHVALLARIAPLITRDDLRARVADVAWVYGDRSNVEMLDLAIDAYRAAPLSDVWFGAGRAAWLRAFALAKRRGIAGRPVVEDMSRRLQTRVLAGAVSDQFGTVAFAELLRQNGHVGAADRASLCETLFKLAADARTSHPRLSRQLEREAVAWLGGSDPATANGAVERIAKTYIAEADARIRTDATVGALVEGQFLEKAIAVLRTLPRSYRVERGLEELTDQLRARLHGSRESAMEQMMRIESDPVDLTDAVSYARSSVSGHAERFAALAAFATLAPSMNADTTRESATNLVKGSIRRLFESSTFSSDARKVAVRPGSLGEEDETLIWAEMVRTVSFHAQFLAKGMIQPALEVLTVEHRYSRDYMISVCIESPLVPEGHGGLWGAGLALGLSGAYGPAVSILVPQLEHAVRTALKRLRVHTLFVDELNGVESEKSLNALLETEEAADIFGAGMVMEMKALLVIQGGPNLRNDIAHGLLDDNSAWSYTALYVWWFCLRLALWPLIRMSDQHAAQEGEVRTASGERVSAGEYADDVSGGNDPDGDEGTVPRDG
ncbi:MAG: hypothetical protein JWP74_4013 [Marmoricola sp.]|nr:hypothetical protein [Marmoricola sp.]